jgi:F-box/leucine-rich repeat protein 10/11
MAVGAPSYGTHTPTAQDAASALNSLAAIASGAGFQNGHGVGKGADRMEVSVKYAGNMATSHGAAAKGGDISPEGPNSAKKGRSKACDECRKSKVCFFVFLKSLVETHDSLLTDAASLHP